MAARKKIEYIAQVISHTISKDNILVVGMIDKNGGLLQFQREQSKGINGPPFFEFYEVGSGFDIVNFCELQRENLTIHLNKPNPVIISVNLIYANFDLQVFHAKLKEIFKGYEHRFKAEGVAS